MRRCGVGIERPTIDGEENVAGLLGEPDVTDWPAART